MKKFKWLRLNLKITYYFCIFFSLLIILMLYPSMLSGEIEVVDMVCVFGIIVAGNSLGMALYSYWMKIIVYIEIEGKTVKLYDLNKREYAISFNEIQRIIVTSDTWVFETYRYRKFFAYRKIWRPYVKKDGAVHKDILPTDFVGVRIDEDYSRII